ncbi:MAG: helix-turn-helix domain-containing protein [Clostridia bacterium]|nr:helix-turn-helix domain-containing protein [Clostridia bacterium]
MALRLTQEEIERILQLYAQCQNCSAVAQLVGRSATTVANVIKQSETQRSAKED